MLKIQTSTTRVRASQGPLQIQRPIPIRVESTPGNSCNSIEPQRKTHNLGPDGHQTPQRNWTCRSVDTWSVSMARKPPHVSNLLQDAKAKAGRCTVPAYGFANWSEGKPDKGASINLVHQPSVPFLPLPRRVHSRDTPSNLLCLRPCQEQSLTLRGKAIPIGA